MKRFGRIFGFLLAVVFIPGILTALVVLLAAKAFGFNPDFNKLKSKLWKKE